MADQGDQAVEMLARINMQLRKAILASFPAAYEQYVTVQMPGTIIDTRQGGSYVPRGNVATADARNKIMCNESALVDSMVPMDKVMLGPTGKSVARSYMVALDMLVPRKTDIGSIDVATDLSGESQSKYSQAMRFLRSRESTLTPQSGIKSTKLYELGGKLMEQGVEGTVVDRYVQKQLAWSQARGEWDAVRSAALEARESRPELQSAAIFSQRQKELKRAQGELHARWMDWVVNGDKYRVEYCFSIVDRDSIMARIERAREATRDSMLTSIDGSEWPQIALEPANWAEICRAKAIDWKTRNPSNPAFLQQRLESLKRMKQAYEVYSEQLEVRGKPRQPRTLWNGDDGIKAKYEGAVKTYDEENKKTDEQDKAKMEAARKEKDKRKPLYEAMKKYMDLKEENTTLGTQVGTEIDETKKKAMQSKMEANEKKIIELEDAAAKIEETSSLAGPEAIKAKEALADIYKYEEEEREARRDKDDGRLRTATDNLDAAKKRWREANTALQALETKGAIMDLEAGGIQSMSLAIKGHLKSLTSELDELKSQLGATGAGLANAPSAIMGVAEDNTLILAKDSDVSVPRPLSGPTDTEQSADVWTKISFSIGSNSSSTSTRESSVTASANVEVGAWFAKVKASTSVSKGSKEFEKAMSECRVDGSFSAMVVTIRRPWLHAELFQDYDIDIPDEGKLSPGAAQVKDWVDNGDPGNKARKRIDYGKFPAYPVSFIVAADTVLEFKSTESNSKEMMKSLSTDSSIEASYGPWGLKGGASAKTDNKESNQNMEMKDGALRISFQAPQIIGWVSEILPELPRSKNIGGLCSPPNTAFRV
ncbi:hypothetical protein F5Y15DRAFT_415460 [Xylariaceae sp. FL0016]|nr:hypothetical protein F5Y15DRAFT_415460 [Xylariaceae sp. FL0016]